MDESRFTGGLLGMLGHAILAALLTIVTLSIGAPWAICYYKRWETEHTYIDGTQLIFDGTGLQLFGSYIKWMLLTIITLGIFGLWMPIKMQQWLVKHTHGTA